MKENALTEESLNNQDKITHFIDENKPFFQPPLCLFNIQSKHHNKHREPNMDFPSLRLFELLPWMSALPELCDLIWIHVLV